MKIEKSPVATGKKLALPHYKLVFAMIEDEAEMLNVEREVNELIAKGYVPCGPLVMTHLSGRSNETSHTDVCQPMIKYPEGTKHV